jgi:tetratricopeptide (TPR) repeat protein
VASEPARTTEPSPVVQRKPEEVTKPASVSRLKMPVSTRKKTEASEAAPTVPVKKQPEEINSGSSAQLEPRLQKLISEYRRAIELDPKNALAYLKLGNIFFFEMNDLNQARRMYTKVLEIDPGHKLGHNNLGVIFLKQNSFNRAEAEFNTALKIDPSYTDAQYNKACLSARKGEKNEAMARLLRAAQLDPAVPRWAAGDDDLSFLKDMPEFERFIRQPETANTKDE